MSKSFKEHIEISKSGTTFFGLSQGAVGKYLFKHPSYTKQEEIANAFTTMDDELDQLRLKLNKTQKFKQGMMQSLLTGKIRLVKPQGGMT
jgi:type I restriction enzyme S subunit